MRLPLQAVRILAHRIPAADRQIGHRIGAAKQPAVHAAVVEQHLRHRALGLVTRDRASEGAGQDQVTAVVLVVEDRAIALAGRCGLVDKLVFEDEGLTFSTNRHANLPSSRRWALSAVSSPHSEFRPARSGPH
jgi:hypothetical protein